jgi:hypothetical protein
MVSLPRVGHELAHAAWHLAAPERARLAQRLQGEMETEVKGVLRAGRRGTSEGLRERLAALDRVLSEAEVPAEEAEVAIWRELSSTVASAARFRARA